MEQHSFGPYMMRSCRFHTLTLCCCVCSPTQEEVEEAARQANAHEFIAQLPEGYNTPVGCGGTHKKHA
jgi:ABC-type transport system involved in cytochrome bd biosynthesis fused ATPase/permease subunit